MPVSGSIETWLLSAAAVIILVERSLALWKNYLREQPPPSTTYVTREMCAQQHSAMAGRLNAVESSEKEGLDRRQLMHDVFDRKTAELHEKVNKVDICTAALKASFAEVSQRVAQIDSKLDRLIERG